VVARFDGFGLAVPPARDQQSLWDGYFKQAYGGSRVADVIFRSSGVTSRHGVIDPTVEDVSGWSTGRRMERYVVEALPLGKEAVGAALDAAGVAASDVGYFAVASCTGYATPGVDIQLARDLGMPSTTQRLMVGHMGCYAAIPAMAAVSDAATARGLTGVLLCTELTSLHAQPPTMDTQQMVAHALFADAAVAVVCRPGRPGLRLVDVIAATDTQHADKMTWDVTDLGFRMGLSPRVPDVLAVQVRGVVEDLLRPHGVDVAAVRGWAVHPGGPRILEVVEERLGLRADALDASRAVLRSYGNCSSGTVLIVLDEIVRAGLDTGDSVVLLAFGPGLTLYAALLRQER
jgi:predicted naringenin-chalcone synthase